MNNCEIERKWLVEGFPNLPVETECEMEQGYLQFAPSAIRIRRRRDKTGESYRLTIKGGGTLRRTEVELPLAKDQYEALYSLLVAPTATKLHRTYRMPGGEMLECNCVDMGQPTAFYYAEVEFDSEAAANAFQPPAFLQREVTEQPGYSMAEYCRKKAGE